MSSAAAPSPVVRQALGVVAAVRSAAWLWATVAALLSASFIVEPWVAVALLAVSGALTFRAVQAVAAGRGPSRAGVMAELSIGAGLLALDPLVFEAGRPQTLAGMWPLAGVLVAAVAFGRGPGAAAGVLLGLARGLGAVLLSDDEMLGTGSALSIVSTAVLYVVAAVAADLLVHRLMAAEDEVADARARVRAGRELHDGVLQTLAAVQRRNIDPELVSLARSTEADLRAWIAGGTTPDASDPAEVLRHIGSEAERRFGIRVQVTVAPPLPHRPPKVISELGAAVGELLANVAKHADTAEAVVFAQESDAGGVEVTVRDRGRGFEPGQVRERGLAVSVRDRVADLAGTVTVSSHPGRGTEARIEIP